MVASGALARLRSLPATLLLAEIVTASTGIALGTKAWLTAPEPDLNTQTRTASKLATLTFAIHAVRQLIYLSPGQGRRATSR